MSGRTQRLRISITGSKVYPSLEDVAFVVNLYELVPAAGRATSRRHGRRFERFAKMGQDLPNRPWLRDERDEPNVTAAVRALKRKLLPHPRHEFRPRNPRRVVPAWLLRRVIRVAAAFRGVTVAPMPAGRGLARLADVADRQRRDGFSQPVVRLESSVIPMPVLPRRRHEVRQPVQELKRNSNGVSSTTPLAPGRVDFRPRPGPTQLAALCLGST